MKTFKYALFALVLASAGSVPALANEDFAAVEDGSAIAEEMPMDAMDPNAARHDRDRDWRRRPRAHVCYARNAAGRTFSARGYNVRNVQYRAVDNCRARSFGPLRFSCRAAGCR